MKSSNTPSKHHRQALKELPQVVAEIRQEAKEKGLDTMPKKEINRAVAAARRDLKKTHHKEHDYTPEQRRVIDSRLAKSDEDIKAGRVFGPFETHEEFIASLHEEAKKIQSKKTKPPVRLTTGRIP